MKELRVSGFGVAGDGVTDDAPAVARALRKIAELSEPCTLIFEKGASYLFRDGQGHAAAIDLQKMEDLTLKGEETTLILDVQAGLHTYVNINECRNIRMEGFRFKNAVPLYEICQVKKVDREKLTMEIHSGRDLGIEEYQAPHAACFGLPYTDYNRMHLFFSRVERISGENYTYRVYLENKDGVDWKLDYMERMGLDFLMPTPGWAQEDYGAFIVTHTENLELENLDMWAYGHFGFHMRYNYGQFLMRNVNITPEPGTNGAMTGWRDGVHLKENRCRFLIENCRFEKMHDDIFNLSCTMMKVDRIFSDREVNLYCPEFQGTYWMALKEGDELTFYDEVHGKKLGKNRIRRVVKQNGPVNRIELANPLPMAGTGASVGVNSLCQPDSVIRGCYLNGTYRFRTPLLMEDCRLDTMFAWVDTLPFVEGPIPENITFRHCDFRRIGAPDPSVSFVSPEYMIAVETSAADGTKPEFACENIVFEGCGLDHSQVKISHPGSVAFRD